MFRLALHSVSYAGVWAGQAKLSLFEFIDKAGELGFDAVMLMAKRPHLSVLDVSHTQQTSPLAKCRFCMFERWPG